MKLADAQRLAQKLMLEIAPYCDRIAVAGSIRRRVPEVKDIELLAIPKWSTNVNELHKWATSQGTVLWIKPATSAIQPWEIRPDGKYWRGLLKHGLDVKLDFFLCSAENWGLMFLIRTGSAEFSEAVVTYGKRLGKRFHRWLLASGRNGRIADYSHPGRTRRVQRTRSRVGKRDLCTLTTRHKQQWR